MHADIFFLFLCLPFFPEMKVQLQPSKRWVVFQSSPNAKNSQPCVWSSKTRRKQLTLWTTFAQQQNNFSLKHVKSILFGCKKKKKNMHAFRGPIINSSVCSHCHTPLIPLLNLTQSPSFSFWSASGLWGDNNGLLGCQAAKPFEMEGVTTYVPLGVQEG